jgi:hypothetical protein
MKKLFSILTIIGIIVISSTTASTSEAQVFGVHCCTRAGICGPFSVAAPVNSACWCDFPAGTWHGRVC